jgi:outer membrane receptor protein involved in Fe transport
LDVTYNWGEHTQYVLSAAYMEPRITEGIYRGNAPVLTAHKIFSQFIRHAWGQRWAVTAGVNHVGKRAVDYDNALYLPAYSTVDVAASYSWPWGGTDWRLRLGVNNLFDEQYSAAVTPGVRINTAERRMGQLTLSTQW